MVHLVQWLAHVARLTRPNLSRVRSEIARASSERADLPLDKYRTKWYGFAVIRVFKTRTICRSMKRSGLTDNALWAAVLEMSQGLIDADLGGHAVKKRVAIPGQGKRGAA